MDEAHVTVIPASAGWCLLSPVWDGHSVVEIIYEPVIGWRIDCYHDESYAEPVTADMVTTNDGVLKRPDGSLFVPGECEIPNEDGAIKWIMEDRERKEKAMRKRIEKP